MCIHNGGKGINLKKQVLTLFSEMPLKHQKKNSTFSPPTGLECEVLQGTLENYSCQGCIVKIA